MKTDSVFADNSFNNVEVFVRLIPLPSVSTTLPCVSLKEKMLNDTLLGLGGMLDVELLELEELLEALLLDELELLLEEELLEALLDELLEEAELLEEDFSLVLLTTEELELSIFDDVVES